MKTKIDLVTGFLGAGKTSFIQSYADWLRRQGTSFAVVENDFGAVGVDAAALKAECGDVFEVSGGCICCSLTPNFTELLHSLCGHYERIIVEPSGVFDAAVFYSIMDTLQRKTEVELGFCAVIVDPHALAELDTASLAVLQSQLAGAGSILWSKCDLPDVPNLHECTALLHTLLPDLPPVETASTRDFTDFALLQTRTDHLRSIEAEKLNHTSLYFCPFHKVERPLTRAEAEWLLREIVASPEADGLLRLKGTVPAAEGGFWAVDSVLHATGVSPAAEGSGVLYFITRRAQAAGIGQLVERLLEELDGTR